MRLCFPLLWMGWHCCYGWHPTAPSSLKKDLYCPDQISIFILTYFVHCLSPPLEVSSMKAGVFLFCSWLSLPHLQECVVQRWYWIEGVFKNEQVERRKDVIVPFWGPGLVFLLRIPMILRGINCRYCLAQFSGSLPTPSEVQAWCQTCIIEELSAHPQWQRESLSILI